MSECNNVKAIFCRTVKGRNPLTPNVDYYRLVNDNIIVELSSGYDSSLCKTIYGVTVIRRYEDKDSYGNVIPDSYTWRRWEDKDIVVYDANTANEYIESL